MSKLNVGGLDEFEKENIEIQINYLDTATQIKYLVKGNVFFHGTLKNGLADGVFNFIDGEETTTGIFKKGLLEGKKTIKIGDDFTQIETYENDLLNGPVYQLDREGRYMYFAMFKDGKRMAQNILCTRMEH